MKTIRYTILLLLAAVGVHAEVINLRSVIKPGVQLIYVVEAGGKTYDFIVTVKDLAGKKFDWKMGEPVNRSGSITHTAKGLQNGDVLFNYFSGGPKTLDNRTTSVWLSQKLFKHFQSSAGKPVKVYAYGAAKPPVEMGTFTGSIPFEILVDGETKEIEVELVKKLVKSGKEYIVGSGDESLHYNPDKSFPIIFRMNFDFYLQLKEVKTK